MDTSTPQPVTSATTVSRTQAPQLAVTPGPIPQPSQPISGAHEQERPIQTATVAEVTHDTEEESPVKQEVGAPSSPQPKEELVEIKASVPEVAVEKAVENVVEKSADAEKPQISEQVKAVGVTHSGPGVPVQENSFAIKSMPLSFQQAVVIDKETKIKDSKHWLAELVIYIWRKLDPTLSKKGVAA